MPMDVVTMIASVATILVALFGGFAWFLRRMDAGFATQEARMEHRFVGIDARFDRVEARLDRVEVGFTQVQRELTEVKIAVARLEGPTPRLVTTR